MDFKILDCTLRDGGYYTNWIFDNILVKDLVYNLDKNGIDIIELGYKTPNKQNFQRCDDDFIQSIIDFDITAKLAFMIDMKDFINVDGVIDKALITDTINKSDVSPFDICRIAIKYNELLYLNDMIEIIENLGYTVICNLMGGSLLTLDNISNFINTIDKNNILYIADSYGSMTPNVIQNIINMGMKGIHTHDNMGLAFANCIEAINCGATYIDGTITGMGRGVGNVKTEQLLLYRNNYISNELLSVIDTFEDIRKVYNWGFSVNYMLSAMNNIHPLYIQSINKLTMSNSKRNKYIEYLKNNLTFDSSIIENIKDEISVCIIIPARYKSSRFEGKPLAKIMGKEMILHVAEVASECVTKLDVIIATDDVRIYNLVNDSGYKAIMTSEQCLTGTDRIAELVIDNDIDYDIYINIQGDEPMISKDDIMKVINYKKESPDCIINCFSEINNKENATEDKIIKVITDNNNNLLYMSRCPIPYKSDVYMKQVCIYAFEKVHLEAFYNNKFKSKNETIEDIEILRFLDMGFDIKMLEVSSDTHAVDYEEDIKIVEQLWGEK